MEQKKPDYTCSRRAFIMAAFCLFIGVMGYDDGTLSFMSTFAIIPMYAFFGYGIFKRRQEKRAFREEVEEYNRRHELPYCEYVCS